MRRGVDLTQGPILGKLFLVALPIMATSFIQMAYNMADMFWIGRVGYDAVSAVGTAGFFMWLSMALVSLSQVGAQVGVSQAIGAKDYDKAERSGRSALHLAAFNGICYMLFALLFRHSLIQFFAVPNPEINLWGEQYLAIVALGFPFAFMSMTFTSIYNGSGNSQVPLMINAVGLVLNMLLDPVMIFGLVGFPEMGVAGAALATVIAQSVVAGLFVWHIHSKYSPVQHFRFFKTPDFERIKQLLKLGYPVAIQSGTFTVIAMFIARRLSDFGDMPIAVQKVGSQIEAISWMTAVGFGTALGAFVGQNYGAKAYGRIKEGYRKAVLLMFAYGTLTSLLLIFFAEPIFSVFIPDPNVIPHGAVYLRILGVSQLFMCLEISTAGAFNGMGKTVPPSVVSFIFTGLRLPVALLISQPEILGLNGVWWTITGSSIFKGVVLVSWFVWVLKTDKRFKALSQPL